MTDLSSPKLAIAGSADEVAAPTDTVAATAGRPAAATDCATRPPSLWSSRDYLAWWTGNTVSALGTSLSTFAYPLVVLFATGSVTKAGEIGSANLIGMLVSMLWGGALADRVSRRAILIAGPLLQAVLLGGVATLVSLHRIDVPVLALAALLSGIVAAVVLGPSMPALRRIVPRDQLPAASAQAQARDMVVQLLGGPVGGFLFAIARALPFAADAVSYLFAAAGAALIRQPLGPDKTEHVASSVSRDIADGFRFIRHQPFLRLVVIFGAVVNLTSTTYLLLLTALVKFRGGGPTEIGSLIAVAVAGQLAGTIAGPALLRKLGARQMLCLALWCYTVSIPAVAVVPHLWQIAVILLLSSVSAGPMLIVVQSYSTRMVPDKYTGRVSAVARFCIYALMWAGPLLAGGLAALFGIRGGMAALLVLALPLTIVVQLSKATSVLRLPLKEVPEAALPDRLRPADTASAPSRQAEAALPDGAK